MEFLERYWHFPIKLMLQSSNRMSEWASLVSGILNKLHSGLRWEVGAHSGTPTKVSVGLLRPLKIGGRKLQGGGTQDFGGGGCLQGLEPISGRPHRKEGPAGGAMSPLRPGIPL